MASFTDQMRALAEGLAASAQERARTVSRLNEETDRLLGSARSRVSQLHEERHTRAEALHATLQAERRALAELVAALRGSLSLRLRESSDQLRERLADNRSSRSEVVQGLLAGFRQILQARADDRREGARVWRSRERC